MRLSSGVVAILIALALPHDARGQTYGDTFSYDGAAHVSYGAGSCQHGVTNMGADGSLERLVWKGLSVGGDFGYHRQEDDVSFGVAFLTLGIHFVDRAEPTGLDPFVSISPLGVYFAGGDVSGRGAAVAVGAGLNYWVKRGLGLHFDVRFQTLGWEEAQTIFRVGVSFR